MPAAAGTDVVPEIPQGFPRSSRLLRPADYRRVFSGAERLGGRYLTLLHRPADGKGPRLGLAISRKTLPRAVDRNRVKRLLRERFRLRRRELPDVDIVFISRIGIADAGRARLGREIDRLLGRLIESRVARLGRGR